MLTRFISGFSHRRLLSLASSRNFCLPSQPSNHSHLPPFNPNYNFILESFRCFSSNRKDNGGGATKDSSTSTSWRFSPDNHNDEDSLFRDGEGSLAGISDGDAYCGVGSEKTTTVESQGNDESWSKDSTEKGDIFSEIDKEFGSKKSDGNDEWETAEGYRPWSFVDEDRDEVFDLGVVEALPSIGDEGLERKRSEADKQLEKEEQELLGTLKGPNRAFGDLIAASGITEAMLDSLMLLKDLENVEGLPPLTEIEDIRLEKNERKSTRAEIERQKQEEVAKARVRQVDEKGRAYGTGRRKCSIARVWIEPGDGKFIVNDKQFDVYFPLLDHRADLLRPFSETKTLGLWDVKCTVKGGGVSGQVGAIRLGIGRALQNWEPGLRPYLRSAGLLTRDPRVVERKKPGKAKARKSFQWVKR
ncbi:PREDICTED: 37S ribosomal protein S9, mitochondrial [Nelumbo nucifera]|uniref:37S ribosomal protein S9, mitochondrial n=1 Tax=Nelumbo nucifera TaxID=4432 RepID=A0A1U8BB88_NELNU|nr:PREDICTED: 37S ribosomal protein S9, mitochondrial [Nelumbo nucifera]XP_010277026.1 PREDICTED: 37S ribosomal protein S9, mitochondrial [Nelumbo nucifera]